MKNRLNRRQAWDAIKNREAFSNSTGSLRGETSPRVGPWDTGRLNESERKRLETDRDTVGISYIVYSYATPIGWVTNDGVLYKVTQKFSPTTSCHWGLIS
jgi:hypothetical protein